MQLKLIMLMKENNITNKQLASILNISEKQVGKKLKGESDFKSSECFKLSKYFDKPIEDIFLPTMYENGTKQV